MTILAGETEPMEEMEDFEDMLPEVARMPKETLKEQPRAAVEVSADDKAEVMKMHVNL